MAKIMLSVPDDWKEPINDEAARHGMSLNAWLQNIVGRVLRGRGYTLSKPTRRGRPPKADEETTEQQ